jgi:hypothetical protein
MQVRAGPPRLGFGRLFKRFSAASNLPYKQPA